MDNFIKYMIEKKSKKQVYTNDEVCAILENIRDNFRTFSGELQYIKEKQDAIFKILIDARKMLQT